MITTIIGGFLLWCAAGLITVLFRWPFAVRMHPGLKDHPTNEKLVAIGICGLLGPLTLLIWVVDYVTARLAWKLIKGDEPFLNSANLKPSKAKANQSPRKTNRK